MRINRQVAKDAKEEDIFSFAGCSAKEKASNLRLSEYHEVMAVFSKQYGSMDSAALGGMHGAYPALRILYLANLAP